MPPTASPSISVSRRGPTCLGSDPLHTVVWVRGEHDASTSVHLSVTLADAARLDDADIFVDLSGVTFMDASTVSALVGARNRLRAQSRSLSVRDPSPLARRVVDLCGLSQLIDEHPEPAASLLGTALGTWVSVPARRLRTDTAPPSITPEASAQEPADAVEEQLEPARLFQRRRAWR